MKPVSTREKIMLELVGGMSPQAVQRDRQIANSQFGEATSGAPVQHWTQALNRVAQGLGSSMRETRAATAEHEAATLQRQALTDALAGGDLGAAAKTLMGNAGTADQGAALAGKVITDRQAQARAASDRQYQDGAMMRETQRRAQIAAQYGLQEGTPEFQQFVLTGKLQQPEQGAPATDDIQEYRFAQQGGYTGSFMDFMAARKSAGQQLSPTDRKAIQAADDDVAAYDNVLSRLDRALELNKTALEGFGSGTWAKIQNAIPGAASDRTKDTAEFDNLMSQQAIAEMSASLKGATTDRELFKFLEMAGNTSLPRDLRARYLSAAKERMQRLRDTAASRADGIRGGTYYQPGAAGGGGQTFVYDPATGELRPE